MLQKRYDYAFYLLRDRLETERIPEELKHRKDIERVCEFDSKYLAYLETLKSDEWVLHQLLAMTKDSGEIERVRADPELKQKCKIQLDRERAALVHLEEREILQELDLLIARIELKSNSK